MLFKYPKIIIVIISHIVQLYANKKEKTFKKWEI